MTSLVVGSLGLRLNVGGSGFQGPGGTSLAKL